jgi:hypothetical protein
LTRVWTIEIGGTARQYKRIRFDRKLKMDSPTSFTASIKYYNNISYFDTVTIKRDGTTEWMGYVETIETTWDSDGRYLKISGRDASVILWKKYTENFSNSADKTLGFFGLVDSTELLKFLLRCPKSDTGSSTTNKSGWGIKQSHLSCSAFRTAKGSPDYCKMRKRGLGWKNSGSDSTPSQKTVQSATLNSWAGTGVAPYCHTDATPQVNYAQRGSVDTDLTCAEWTIQDLVGTATGVNGAILKVKIKADQNFWAWMKASGYISVYIASWGIWQKVVEWSFGAWYGGGWIYKEFNLGTLISSVSDFNNLKIRAYSTSGDTTSYIGYIGVSVTYTESGEQTTEDHFDINLNEPEEIMGVYIESRMSDDEYPRHYKIESKNENNVPIAGAANGWVEEPAAPNNGIVEDADGDTITFDSYTKNEEYNYKDYGATGSPLDIFEKTFKFKVTSAMESVMAFGLWMVSEELGALKTQVTNDYDFISCYVKKTGGLLYFCVDINEPNQYGRVQEGYATPLTLNTEYVVRVKKESSGAGSGIWIELYDSSGATGLYSFTLPCPFMGSPNPLRYEFFAFCYGNGYEFSDIFDDDFDDGEFDWTDWTRIRDDGHNEPTKDSGYIVSAPYSCKMMTDTLYGNSYVEKEFSETDYARLDWWLRHESPKSEVMSKDVPISNYIFVIQEWTGIGSTDSTWLMKDDTDDNYIFDSAENSSVGDTMGDWTFGGIDTKYMSMYCTAQRLYMSGALSDGVGGHANYVNVQVKIWCKSRNAWLDRTITFNSTSWSTKDVSLQNSGVNWLQTLDDVRNVKIRIVLYYVDGGGADKGGIRVGYVKMHFDGVAYWGDTIIAKIFDKDAAGIESPYGFATKAMVGLKVVDETDDPDQYHFYISWWDDSGYHKTITDIISDATWTHLYLYLEVADGDGYIGLFSGASEENTIFEASSLENSTLFGSKVDCFTLCNHAQVSDMLGYALWVDSVGLDGVNKDAHTIGVIYSEMEQFTEIISEVDNSDPVNHYRDIIHSWSPQVLRNIRISITEATASKAWSVSQIYVYKADDSRFRIFLESGETDNFGSATYAGGPYVKDWSFDEEYDAPMDPQNIPQARLIDVINRVVAKLYDTGYVPYEWWLALDSDHTFHLAKQKGSDVSGTVSFIKGTNLGGTELSKSVVDTVQRVYVVGRGEGKTKEDISKWVEDETAMDSVKTFFEDIYSEEKTIANEDEAEVVGEVYLHGESTPKETITVTVSNDPYATMAYDVGDIVTITDSLTGISGTHRIYNIDKTITNNGEDITLTVGSPLKLDDDEIAGIYKRLKQIETGDVLIADWTAEGVDTDKISQSKITAQFEKSAKNEEQNAPNDQQDPAWDVSPTPSYQNTHPPKATFAYGQEWLNSSDYMELKGNNSSGTMQHLRVAIKGAVSGDGEYSSIKLRRNPKMIIEFKLREDGPPYWNNGDILRIGFADTTYTKGYWLFIKKVDDYFYAWLAYSTDGTNEYLADGKPVSSDETTSAIRQIMANVKYRFTLEFQMDETSNTAQIAGNCIAKLIQITGLYSTDVTEEENPDKAPAALISVNNPDAFEVVPLFMKLSSVYTTDKLARCYIYKFHSEWEKVVN